MSVSMVKQPVAIMHLVDSLAVGGTERVAVNLVNHLPRACYRPILCATRRDGPLAREIAGDVEYLSLGRRATLDAAALYRLVRLIQLRQVRLLHAHSSSLFVAVIASLFPPFPKVLWHDHFGRADVAEESRFMYRVLVKRTSGVIAVNQLLADWSRRILHVPVDRVWYIPNFSDLSARHGQASALPGVPGQRVICVANLRPQKDHPTLIRAMAHVVETFPAAHLILVGAPVDLPYRDRLLAEVERLRLRQHVTWLGQRDDVADILHGCDIGVLTSLSEGLPLSLIEYGMAGLPAVTTKVGQCPEVLDDSRAGILVPAGGPEQLAQALIALLGSPRQRDTLGRRLQERVQTIYGADAVLRQICSVYERLLGHSARAAAVS